MTFEGHRAGYNDANNYIISGIPWVTQSSATTAVTRIDFPYITKFFSIKNNGPGTLEFGFTSNGLNGSNKSSLAVSASFVGDLRIKTLYVKAATGTTSYDLVAGLTLVQPRQWPVLTSSLSGTVFAETPAAASGSLVYNGVG